MAVFEESASRKAAQASAIYTQRGEEYADSWALENLNTTYLDMVCGEFGVKALSPTQKRLVLLACLIDVKDSRMTGGYKEDTLIDRINYSLVFADLMEQYEKEPEDKLAALFSSQASRPQLTEDKS